MAIHFIAFNILKVTNGVVTDNWHLEGNLTLLSQMGLAEVTQWEAGGTTAGWLSCPELDVSGRSFAAAAIHENPFGKTTHASSHAPF